MLSSAPRPPSPPSGTLSGMDSTDTSRPGWLRRQWCRLDAWAAGKLSPEELAEAREADERLKRYALPVLGGFLALSTGFGVLLWVIKPSFGLLQSLTLAAMLCFGLGLCLVSAFYGYRKFVGPQGWRKMATVAVMSFLGVITGIVAASWSLGRPIAMDGPAVLRFLAMAVLVATLLAVIIMGVALMRAREGRQREARLKAEADRERLSRQSAQAELKLLQAQVEPHFLFNTLANVQHLVETDPASASRMLESLIRYLRAALPQMREATTNLGREVDMARAFLDIHRVRMGSRLAFDIEVPEALKGRAFPPMMLISLVENAIKHGVDPCCECGRIVIRAQEEGGQLRVSVVDTGEGIVPKKGGGVGLSNIRERLKALYGASARLVLEENAPRGVVASIEVPSAGAA